MHGSAIQCIYVIMLLENCVQHTAYKIELIASDYKSKIVRLLQLDILENCTLNYKLGMQVEL